LTIVIDPALIITAPSQLPGATAGLPYSYFFSSGSVAAPNGATIVAGQLPPGLTLSGAFLEGTPTVPGSYSFEVSFSGTPFNETAYYPTSYATKQFSLTVGPPNQLQLPAQTQPFLFAVGENPDFVLSAQGGTPPYQFSLISGSVPETTLQPDGYWAGTFTTAGTYSVTVQAQDSTGLTATNSYTFIVDPSLFRWVRQNVRHARVGLPYARIPRCRRRLPSLLIWSGRE
jgi:hypothetical protein